MKESQMAKTKLKTKAVTKAKRKKKKVRSVCGVVIPYRGIAGTGANRHPILMADPCCREGMSIFFNGFNKVAEPTKGHMQGFANILTSSKAELLEYCVMVWGLKLEERSDIVKQMQQRFRMEVSALESQSK